MMINGFFDTEGSKGHVDTVYKKLCRDQTEKHLAGHMRYRNNNDCEKVYEANGMFKEARQFRVRQVKKINSRLAYNDLES